MVGRINTFPAPPTGRPSAPRPQWRANTFTMIVANAAFGVTLIFQEHRYDNTPAYGILLDIFKQPVWGGLYLLIAAGLAATWAKPHIRLLAVIAHTAAIALIGVWLMAFTVRYIVNSGTTIVNVVSWGTYLALLIRSALEIGEAQTPALIQFYRQARADRATLSRWHDMIRIRKDGTASRDQR